MISEETLKQAREEAETGNDQYARGFVSSVITELLEARQLANHYYNTLHEVIEVYVSMDGFIPETAPEAYQERIIRQMYDAEVNRMKK